MVVELPAHARPHGAKPAAHEGQRRRRVRRGKPDVFFRQGRQRRGVGFASREGQILPPEGGAAAEPPGAPSLAQIHIAHAVQRQFCGRVRGGGGPNGTIRSGVQPGGCVPRERRLGFLAPYGGEIGGGFWRMLHAEPGACAPAKRPLRRMVERIIYIRVTNRAC